MKKLAVVALALTALGCAHVISDESRREVDQTISFAELKNNPDLFIGKKVLVGGKIIETRNTNEGGRVEILQFTIDSSGFPIESAKSAGRFLATSPDFLDPAFYKKERLVTIAGEVKGKKSGTVDEAGYTYPVIGIKEIYAWKIDEGERPTDSISPAFYNNYNPYDFSHDVPLWYRPTGPVIRP